MTHDSPPPAPLFGPVVCRRDGHDWTDDPDAGDGRACARCGAAIDAEECARVGISLRLLALAAAVGALVGGLLTAGFLMHGVAL
ncbi:hypothetical protein ACFQPA_07830 [Halomarina halobia]|uniref:Uncharacterized protein n=1 Tax=Halomarina halobia TaxID=3033386 RepID=A0ABD6AC99_9EURY|nr:hypothetical protein [Halomarina sp. PSR21]